MDLKQSVNQSKNQYCFVRESGLKRRVVSHESGLSSEAPWYREYYLREVVLKDGWTLMRVVFRHRHGTTNIVSERGGSTVQRALFPLYREHCFRDLVLKERWSHYEHSFSSAVILCNIYILGVVL